MIMTPAQGGTPLFDSLVQLLIPLLFVFYIAGQLWAGFKNRRSRRVGEATENLERALSSWKERAVAAEARAEERDAAIHRLENRVHELQAMLTEEKARPNVTQIAEMMQAMAVRGAEQYQAAMATFAQLSADHQKEHQLLERLTQVVDRIGHELLNGHSS